MKQNTAQARVIATVVYLLFLLVVQWTIVGTGFPLDQKALWFFNGVASLLLGSRLLNPHFVPPADVATNAFFASATLATAFAVSAASTDKAIIIIAICFCVALLALSLGVILIRRDPRLETRRWVDTAQRVIRGIGSPRVIFTGVILVLTWVFHRESSLEVFAILVTWTLIVALDPVEALIDLLHRITAEVKSADRTIMGEIVAFQHPGLVLIRQQDDTRYPTGTMMALSDTHGPARLGVSLNYVGRDEGVLLRTLSLDVPPKIKQRVDEVSINAAVAVKLEVDDEDKSEVQVLDRVNRLCGIVDSDTTTGFLEVEIINDADLFEGRLVDVKIGSDTVIYQVIDGVTREEFVQQKNKYGFARAKARKIGKWDGAKGKFKQVSWLPALNAPALSERAGNSSRQSRGDWPLSGYHLSRRTGRISGSNTQHRNFRHFGSGEKLSRH